MKPHIALLGGCYTDKGSFRDVNQDAIGFFQSTDGSVALGVVCDGIGGLEKSEEASQLVIKSAASWFNRLSEWVDIETVEFETVFLHFLDAVEDWNEQLYEYLKSRSMHSGTTFSGVLLLGSRYSIISVGDSRIYKLSKDMSLDQLTVDDTRAEMYDGRIRNYLTDHFGKRELLDRTPIYGELSDGDMLIFCTDGYYHEFSLKDAAWLYDSVRMGADPDALCRDSVFDMIRRGETDNISLGMLFYQKRRKKPFWWTL